MKRILMGHVLVLLTLAMSAGMAAAQVDTTGLVAFYPFSGNAGDSSGHGHHGTVYGATLTADRFGNPNSAYSFDGSTSFILVPYSAELYPTAQLTVSAWVRADTWGGYEYSNSIVDCEVPGSRMGYGLRGGDTKAGFYMSTGNWQQVFSDPGTIAAGIWYHLAGRYDGGSLKLYVNGEMAESLGCSGPMIPSNRELRIGTNNIGLRWFDGVIDDVRIYGRALSEEEIDSLYDATWLTAPGLVSPEDSAAIAQTTSYPAFVWHRVDSAEYYRFQLSSSKTFATGSLIEDFTLADTAAVVAAVPPGSGPFWWRVSSFKGIYYKTSEVRTFQLGLPLLVFPPRDTVLASDNTPMFIWNAADSAAYYRIWVARDAGFANVVINHSLYDTSYALAGPLADGHYYWKVKAYGPASLEPFQSEIRHFGVNVYGGVAGWPAGQDMVRFKLDTPYPSPARSAVTVRWELPESGAVCLEVYNVAGQRVAVLADGWRGAGRHAASWNLRDRLDGRVSNGVYLFRLTAGERHAIGKLTVVR